MNPTACPQAATMTDQAIAVTEAGKDPMTTTEPMRQAGQRGGAQPSGAQPTGAHGMSAAAGVVPAAGGAAPTARPKRSLTKLLLVILVCVAPVIASYLAYYVFPPSGRTNYGDLIEPQVTLGPLGAGDPLGRFKGQWMLILVQDGACDEACAKRLFFLRQTHTALGRDRERANMVLLQSHGSPLPPALVEAHPYLTVVPVDAADITRWFPPGAEGQVIGHLYVVDPQHNLMMRYPLDPEPAPVRKDLQRLMKASRIG